MKKVLCLILVFLGLLTSACGVEKTPAPPRGKVPVVVSFEAMRELTEAIGGDKVSITTLVPPGTEPHEFDPKAEDILRIKQARVLVMNGMGMEKWGSRAVKAADNPDLIAVEAARHVKPIYLDEEEKEGPDPHTWLGPKEAKEEALEIRDALVRASPENRAVFERNYDRFASSVDGLTDLYQQKFDEAPRHSFVAGHAAFGYLCRDFGLEQKSVEDVFASGEPPAKKLISLIAYCRAHDVHTIFTEDLMDPALAGTLAKEAGASDVTINTMENREDDGTYIGHMKETLDKILKSLT